MSQENEDEIRLVEGNVHFLKRSFRAPFKISCATLSPKNELIAIGAKNGDVMLKRVSWKQIWKINVSQNTVMGGTLEKPSQLLSLEFSPDGSLLAAGTNDGHVHIIDVELGMYKHSTRLGDEKCPPSVTKLRWCAHYDPASMGPSEAPRREKEVERTEEIESEHPQPPRHVHHSIADEKSDLFKTVTALMSSKHEPSREDHAFVFQMFEEDSQLLKGDDGFEEKFEGMFTQSDKFRGSFDKTVLVAIRDDLIVSVMVAGVLPIVDLDINVHCKDRQLAPVLVYDALYSTDIGGVTVAATTYGPNHDCGFEGLHETTVTDELGVQTHAINFNVPITVHCWEMALRYIRMCHGFITLNAAFENCQKNWYNQLLMFRNRFDIGVKHLKIGDLLIDMLMSGVTDPIGEAFLERGMSIEGLASIRDFCEKQLTEVGRIARGQLTISTRNMVFQSNEFANGLRDMYKHLYVEQHVEEMLTTDFRDEANLEVLDVVVRNEFLDELEKCTARLEYKVKQFLLSCSEMLQELSHLVKWMAILKPFARAIKANMLLRSKRMDIKKVMRYVLDNFVDDVSYEKYEFVMFRLDALVEKIRKHDFDQKFDEQRYYHAVKEEAIIRDKDLKKELRFLRPEVMEYMGKFDEKLLKTPIKTTGQPEDDIATNEDGGGKEMDIDRIGPYFGERLSAKALEKVAYCGDFLDGIDGEEKVTSGKNLDKEARELGLGLVMEQFARAALSSYKCLGEFYKPGSGTILGTVLWMFELGAGPTHQGFQQVTLSQVKDYLDEEAQIRDVLRRAIHVTAVSKTKVISKTMIPPQLNDVEQRERFGQCPEYRKIFVLEKHNSTVEEEPRSESGREQMEVDENLQGLSISVDDRRAKCPHERMIEFETVFPMLGHDFLALGKFETKDKSGGVKKRLMKFSMDTEDNSWIVQNENWGTSELIEWGEVSALKERGILIHDEGTRVSIFSAVDYPVEPARQEMEEMKVLDPRGQYSYREFVARRERVKSIISKTYRRIPTTTEEMNQFLMERMADHDSSIDFETAFF